MVGGTHRRSDSYVRSDGGAPVMIGIFGGTFDPVHLGHLAIADDVANAFGLAEVLFVPNARSPLRRAPVASPSQRFEMCELATSGNNLFAVSRVDIDRDGPSYAIDTIRLLRAEYRDCEFAFIAGTDVLDELRSWRDTDALLREALMIVAERPGVDGIDVDRAASEIGFAGRIVTHRAALMDVSSTDIRHRIRNGLPYRYLLHHRVYDYLRRHRIYKSS